MILYIFELIDERGFFDDAIYTGIYRDDGFMVMEGEWDCDRTRLWLKNFQAEVDVIVGGDFFKFTACVWKPGEDESGRELEGVSAVTNDALPYLDMKMSWNVRGKINFSVYRKPNQRLKYVSSDSTHTRAT